MKNRCLSILLTITLLIGALAGTALGETTPDAAFAITGVEIQSEYVAVVSLNAPMHADFTEFMRTNPNYFDKWIQVNGGVAGEADAALTGNLVDGAKTYPAEDGLSFELVLNEGFSFVAGREYTITFDLTPYAAKNTGAEQSIATFAKDVDDRVISTRPVAFTAAVVAADPALGIQMAGSTDNSTVNVLFDGRVVSGMPCRGNAKGIAATPVKGGDAVPVVYVDPLAGTNAHEFVMYFAKPLEADTEYTLNLSEDLGLTGLVSKAENLSINFVTNAQPLNYSVESAVLAKDGATETLTLTLNKPIYDYAMGDGSYKRLVETPNRGVVANVLTRENVAAMFDFEGVQASDGRELGAALGEICGYFDNSRTIVLHNDNVFSFALADQASIALKDSAIRTPGGVPCMGMEAVPVVSGSVSRGPADWDPESENYLKIYTSSITYRTLDYYYDQYDDPTSELDNYTPGHHKPVEGIDPRLQIVSRSSYTQEDRVDRVFNTYVVENKYIKATFCPEFGGRLLSMIYKPTGNDVFWLHKMANPYGQGFKDDEDPTVAPTNSDSSFYSNWLMVWGGVFPTWPTPEHGKTWYLPWDYEIQEEADRITIAMHSVDDIDYLTTNPRRFKPGHTNLIADVSYMIEIDKPYVQMDVTITNPEGNGDQQYEWWNCNTFAPGEDTYYGSPTMEIVSPTQILYCDEGWEWMLDVDNEKAFPADMPFEDLPQYVKDNTWNNGLDFVYCQDNFMLFNKLAKQENWTRSGIAYPTNRATLPQADWFGVINQSNQEGVLHVGDSKVTPGMKFWVTGVNGNWDKEIGTTYMELWNGTSNRFFTPASIKEGQKVHWRDTYMPTNGLFNVTNATSAGAAEVIFEAQGDAYQASADIFSTLLEKELHAVLKAGDEVVAEKTFMADPLSKVTLTAEKPVPAGTTVTVELYQGDNKVLSAYATQGSKPEPTLQAVEDFSLNVNNKEIKVGESFEIFGMIEPAYAETSRITWYSDNTDVASVDTFSFTRPSYQAGEYHTYYMVPQKVVTGHKAGTANLLAVVEDPVSGKTYTATCQVVVNPAE